MAPRLARPRRAIAQTFHFNLPQGVVVRPENTICKVDIQLRLLAETGATIKKVRTDPDLIWEVPMDLEEASTADRVHVPLVTCGLSPHSVAVHLQSFTQSQEVKIDLLDQSELECVVCQEKMLDPEVSVYKCRSSRHFLCEPCVLNMDATSSDACDKCPVCRLSETFHLVSNWHMHASNFLEECAFGCGARFVSGDAEAEDTHYTVCKSITSPSSPSSSLV